MKKLWSIFTDDMNKCIVTSAMTSIERHHVFGGADRKKSEKYGFVVPLHSSVHPNGAYRTDDNWKELDHWLKRKCQEYFIEVAKHGDRDAWYREFGRFYDDRCDEDAWYREFGRFYDDRCDEKVWLNGKFEWRL